VSWDDAQEYVRWLSRRTGKPYRLLSEAEWEYAARAGSPTRYSFGDDIPEGKANCNNCGSRFDRNSTAPVDWPKFPANAFGLHVMHGNVAEWVEDCYQLYTSGRRDGSPQQGQGCNRRVARGGHWFNLPGELRAARRPSFEPSDRRNYIGFRIARTLDSITAAKNAPSSPAR
jgi:formylglycine-generating enzyme required for sulfatase activity